MRLSGSKIHLAYACGYAFRPDVNPAEREPGAAAMLGNEVHDGADALVKGTYEPSMYDAESRKYIEQVRLWLEDVGKPTASEIAVIYDTEKDTARQVFPKKHRDYGPTSPMEIPTTLDLVWRGPNSVVVRDLKSGSKQHAHREQLVIQALAVSRLYDVPAAEVGFLFARKTKCVAEPLEALTAEDLDAEAWRASALMRSLPIAQPQPGRHCWFCDARPICPAHDEPSERDREENACSTQL